MNCYLLQISLHHTDTIYLCIQKEATANAPNTLINPDSFGVESWVAAGSALPFNIRFANLNPIGSTPIAKVTITQQLDSDLDLNTFSFGDISFGDTFVEIPFGQQSFLRRVDLRDTQGIFVDIDAALNPATRNVTWSLTAIDPTSGNPVDPSTNGFLLPNDDNGVGFGLVSYDIQPLINTANSTRIDSQANISFNGQTPTTTDAVFITLDSDNPQSKVEPLPATTNNPSFTVNWTGSDASSGIDSYDVYVSVDGEPFTIWKSDTTRTSDIYTGEFGRTYRFYSIATDNAGLSEIDSAQVDATIAVGTTNLALLDVDGSGGVPTFARDALLLAAFAFYYRSDRTDYSILDRFVLDSKATRKTGQEIADYLKDKIDLLDVDGSGEFTFSRDGLLLAATMFYYRSDRTDYSVLDRFVLDAKATRKTGQEIADYLKDKLTIPNTGSSSLQATLTSENNIIGTTDNDILVGDAGNNIIIGGAGNDILTGDLGRDIFSFSIDSGWDEITDFNVAEDTIQLDSSWGFTSENEVLAAIEYRDSVAELTLNGEDKITFGVDRALSLDNIAIV